MATWPNTIILVHGYGDSRLTVGAKAQANAGQEDNFWYWQGTYSDGEETYNVPQDLINAAGRAGAQVQIKAANWDGRSQIQTSVEFLIELLDKYCTGSNTCDLVGHSTGDALIGYALDKFQAQKRWNINTVFVAGGAGGGTEAADWSVAFSNTDPVVSQLICTTMRALYNHNMYGLYANVPNIRFVGAGTKTDNVNQSINPVTGKPQSFIPYNQGAWLCRGYSDGLVPFHSQGGVSNYVGNIAVQAYDAYCTEKHTGIFLSCGQLNSGNAPAQRWNGPNNYVNVPLFNGFYIALIDTAREYNHTDEVGRLAQWIITYRENESDPNAPPPGYVGWTTSGIYAFHQGAGNSGQLWYSVYDPEATPPWQPDQQIANVGMSESPSAVAFNGQFYVLHQGAGNSGQLWYSVLDQSWQADQYVSNVGMSGSPSAVVFNGQLYVFHQGAGDSTQLWYSVFDGTNWQQDQYVANVGMSESPSAVVFNGQLYVFHQGAGDSGQLWYSAFDGTNWQQDQYVSNVGMSGSPSAVVFNGLLYVFHQGAGNSGQLWYLVFNDDVTGWSQDQYVANVGMSESPSAVVFAGQIYVFHQGAGDSTQLWYSVYDGTNWSQDQQITNVGMSSSPGCLLLA
jgi:hypothetical protein